MPRIRTIKPSHWNDKELAAITLQAHLLWIGTWNFSDDRGVFESDPLLLKSQIFPRRTDIRVDQIKSWLDQLVKARFILPFEYNSEGYYVNRTFETHQRIDKPQPSKVPPDVLCSVFQEHSKNVPRMVPAVLDSIVREGKVGDGEAETHTSEELEGFKKLTEWIKEKATRVGKMSEPLTIKEFLKIRERFPDRNFIAKILLAMHNWGDLKKRQSAYLTFLSFAEREEKVA